MKGQAFTVSCAEPQTLFCSDSLNQVAKFLARFEEGNSLRWHFDSGSSFWIPSDARSSLARVESSESADFNLVPGSQRTDDAVKYGANDDVGFLPGQRSGLTNLFSQISPGHLEHPGCITKKSIEVCLRSPCPSRLRPARRARHAPVPSCRPARRDLPIGDSVPGRPADLRALAAGFPEPGAQHERLGILDARAA